MYYFLFLVDFLLMGNICNKVIYLLGGIFINILIKDFFGVYSCFFLFLECVILFIVCVNV